MPQKKLDYTDIVALRDRAIKKFLSYPYRLRLPGMHTDLFDADKRILAHFEASVEMLNRLGILDYEKFMEIWPTAFTEVQEVIDEGTYGANFTQQKD